MLSNVYLFNLLPDLDQIAKIFQVLGTPTEETWPGHTKLPDYVQFKYYPPTPLVS
jgi:cyclin-dependent kinase 7